MLRFYFRGGGPWTSKSNLSRITVTEFVEMFAMNLVTPKAAAKGKLLFNKPAYSVTKFI